MYTYQKASLMCMLDPRDLTSSEKKTIDQLMHEVPKYKQRIAGKSLPMEKFACKRAERFFLTGTLVIPAIGKFQHFPSFSLFDINFSFLRTYVLVESF